MTTPRRPPSIHHCTSVAWKFFGRAEELALLNDAVGGGEPSLIAMIGQTSQAAVTAEEAKLVWGEEKVTTCRDPYDLAMLLDYICARIENKA